MGFITPEEINQKARNAYPKVLALWIAGGEADFFPHRVRANLKLDSSNPNTALRSIEKLLKGSKDEQGWGYRVERIAARSRDFGKNLLPTAIWIDTLDDLLQLAGCAEEFERTEAVVKRLRERFPDLENWIKRHIRSLHKLFENLQGLISVTEFFLQNPWPDCYARQIPVEVDTKFVSRNASVLKQWLDILQSDTAIDPSETKFERRFGLRDGQAHRGIRFLHDELMQEVGQMHGELSLPVRSIAKLPISNSTVFVVENNLNLLTLPEFERGVGIQGAGNAVNRLEKVRWLNDNNLIYWGDNDVDGFLILSRLRNLFPHVKSVMMDTHTMMTHRHWCLDGNANSAAMPTNLTQAESEAFRLCNDRNLRLEQEKILQSYVDQVFQALKHRTS